MCSSERIALYSSRFIGLEDTQPFCFGSPTFTQRLRRALFHLFGRAIFHLLHNLVDYFLIEIFDRFFLFEFRRGSKFEFRRRVKKYAGTFNAFTNFLNFSKSVFKILIFLCVYRCKIFSKTAQYRAFNRAVFIVADFSGLSRIVARKDRATSRNIARFFSKLELVGKMVHF